MPKLTIITITYNAERYLKRTLESVRMALGNINDISQVEYLIIDGKSADKTLQIASQYKGFITKTVSEPDKGLYDAMNKGLLLASGDYVWFLNAGDEIYDSNVLTELFKNLNSHADIYYSDAMLVRDNGDEVGLRSKFTPHELPKSLKWQDFLTGMKVCHQAFIVKRDITPQYDITNLSADIDWEIKCLKSATKIKLLPFVLCKYLMGGTSVQNHRKSLTDRFEILRRHFGLSKTILAHLYIFWRGFWFSWKNGKYW